MYVHSLGEASAPVAHDVLSPAHKPTLAAPVPSSPLWRGQLLPQSLNCQWGLLGSKGARVSLSLGMEQPSCSRATLCHLALVCSPCKPPPIPNDCGGGYRKGTLVCGWSSLSEAEASRTSNLMTLPYAHPGVSQDQMEQDLSCRVQSTSRTAPCEGQLSLSDASPQYPKSRNASQTWLSCKGSGCECPRGLLSSDLSQDYEHPNPIWPPENAPLRALPETPRPRANITPRQWMSGWW